MNKFYVSSLILLCSFNNMFAKREQQPKLVVGIVIDQFAHHYLAKLQEHFTEGFDFLLKRGIRYHNAHQPHGAPSTAPGHASMSTGTFPADHGVVLNGWVEQGEKVVFGDDNSGNATLLSSPELHPYGKSSKHLLAETLSDRLVQSSTKNIQHHAIALSYKSRASIALAGTKGSALWFNAKKGIFDSSKAYFDTLPSWVKKFNEKHAGTNIKSVDWKLRYGLNDEAYSFHGINDRRYATRKRILANTTIDIVTEDSPQYSSDEDDFEEKRKGYGLFLRTPQANQMLFDLARSYLTNNYSSSNLGTSLLWISLSSLDMLGHEYGPHSLEIIDMIYHLDKQIGDFIRFCKKIAGNEKDICFVLTADHGIAPLPEVQRAEGFWMAQRTPIKPLIKRMNDYIERKYGILDAVTHFKSNQIYMNTAINEKRNEILLRLKHFLSKQLGVKKVWTREELLASTYQPYELESLFKNQYHPERSGDLICMTYPYHALTPHPTGTAHRSPYDYDTHIPLIFYREGMLENKDIYTKVWSPQIAVSLAHIMGISKPAAARYEILPGITD